MSLAADAGRAGVPASGSRCHGRSTASARSRDTTRPPDRVCRSTTTCAPGPKTGRRAPRASRPRGPRTEGS
jgi:hypothetical protein